jgi:hypothetical protein
MGHKANHPCRNNGRFDALGTLVALNHNGYNPPLFTRLQRQENMTPTPTGIDTVNLYAGYFNARTSATLEVVCQKEPPVYEPILGVNGSGAILLNAAELVRFLESYPLNWEA